MAKKYDIFISYRRKGGIKDARLVDEKLRNSGYSVSFDIDTLGRGKFTDTLNKRLKDCKDFIVIFEPSYYQRFYDENGNEQPETVLDQDWCYLELKNALQMNKNIVPLVPEDFIFPSNLPKGIKDIAEVNAIQLTEKEFKEIFEYKVKSYLVSKPKFTRHYRKPIAAVLLLIVLAVITYVISFVMESQKKAAQEVERVSAEAQQMAKAAEERADSIKKSMEARGTFIADSIKKLGETQIAKPKEPTAAALGAGASASQKTELYWVSNGDETGKVLFEKLFKAGLKNGKCSGNGIKVLASSKPACNPNAMGVVKCAYVPQITTSACDGTLPNKLSFEVTFNGSHKEEAVSRQKLVEDLQKANFSAWVNKLQALKK
jgi:uncharacterized protein (UPF0333 family)